MEQQTEEWLQLRQNYIGSSDAPVIMQVSPWKTPYMLWKEKLGLAESQKKTAAMQFGIDNEENGRHLFEKMTGHIMFPKVIFHPIYPWMMASLDGMDLDSKYILEIKHANKEDHETARRGLVPEKYIPQVQHQLEVANLSFGYYFSVHDGKGVIVEVARDEHYIESLIQNEFEFWHTIKILEPPELTKRDYMERKDDIWVETCKKWRKLNQMIKELEREEEVLRESLISLAGDSNVIGGGVKLSKIAKKGSIDYKSIPMLEHMDLEKYRKKPTESWRITCH